MLIGVVGRGYWGKTYVDVLTRLGIPFWVDGREWHARERPSGLIVACSSDAHYEVAKRALQAKIPVLVEKPVCMKSRHAQELIAMGGIALAGHTRLYDPTWSTFKASVGIVQSVEAYAGGVNDTNPDAEWNWWTHLAAMCWDLGFDPGRAAFHVTPEKQPLRFIANGMEFRDGPPGALACLVTEFVKAIEKGEPDNEGLRLGLKTIQYVEERRRSR